MAFLEGVGALKANAGGCCMAGSKCRVTTRRGWSWRNWGIAGIVNDLSHDEVMHLPLGGARAMLWKSDIIEILVDVVSDLIKVSGLPTFI